MTIEREYFRDATTHYWRVLGDHGAVHLWASIEPSDWGCTGGDCGLEIHYRVPPSYMRDNPPSHDTCRFLHGAPCWHDGSSIAAIDHWIPCWQIEPDNHDRVLDRLEARMPGWFAEFDEIQELDLT